MASLSAIVSAFFQSEVSSAPARQSVSPEEARLDRAGLLSRFETAVEGARARGVDTADQEREAARLLAAISGLTETIGLEGSEKAYGIEGVLVDHGCAPDSIDCP